VHTKDESPCTMGMLGFSWFGFLCDFENEIAEKEKEKLILIVSKKTKQNINPVFYEF